METFANAILPIIPACACFGPAFLMFGVVLRTPVSGPVHPKRSAAFLVAGTVMTTLTLVVLLVRTM
jgi:hypothetical protein